MQYFGGSEWSDPRGTESDIDIRNLAPDNVEKVIFSEMLAFHPGGNEWKNSMLIVKYMCARSGDSL